MEHSLERAHEDNEKVGCSISISEAFLIYRDDVVILKGQSPRTEESLLVTSKIVTNYLSNCCLKSITIKDFREFHKDLLKKRLKSNTIRGYLLHVRSVLRYCKQRGDGVTFDPELIIVPKREESIPAVLTPKEVQHAINSITPSRGKKRAYVSRNKAIVSMLYASGLRVSEMCSIDKKDAINGSATVLGKGNKPRLVFWDDRTKHLLSEYLATREDNNPALFTSPISGKRMNRYDVLEVFIKLREDSGLEGLHAHTLRHSYATNLADKGMPIHTLARLMGHSNIATTSRYLHVADPKMREEYLRYHTI